MTKHFSDYKVLMLGRVLGGISTSLLFRFNLICLPRFFLMIAYTLSCSVFDSWMIAEHNARGSRFMQGSSTSSELLGDTFSKAMFGGLFVLSPSSFCCLDFCCLHPSPGNSVVAIFSGLIAEPLSQNVEHRTMTIGSQVVSFGRFTVPFDLASLFLLGCFVVINLKWSENFGERQSDAGVLSFFYRDLGDKSLSRFRCRETLLLAPRSRRRSTSLWETRQS